jgi:hypothetical protein
MNSPQLIGKYIAYRSGDTFTYIEPMNNYLDKGDFALNVSGEDGMVYIGRGPYCAIPYYLFSQFMPRNLALDCVAFLQLVLISIAFTCLISIVNPLIVHKRYLFLLPFVLLVPAVATRYIFTIDTECFALSFFLLFCYFYILFLRYDKNNFLIISAIFLAILGLLKPYFLPLFALLFLHYLIQRKRTAKELIHYVLLMSLPLIIFALPFTIRNLVRFNTFAPFQNTAYAGLKSPIEQDAMRKTVALWGESSVRWESESLGSYFMPLLGKTGKYRYEFPQRLIVKGYTMSDIVKLKNKCAEFATNPTKKLSNEIINEFSRFREIYLEEKPLEIVSSKFRLAFLLIRPPLKIPDLTIGVQSTILFVQHCLYYSILILGFFGLLLLSYFDRKYLFVCLFVCYILIFFSVLGAPERRFFMQAYFMFIVGSIYFVDKIHTGIISKSHSNNSL